ncbi:MAG TPA: aminoglycoside phosphotransferase family protein [Candidatus Polarisedimenticolia bacterium]|nr:aminoglycoside phosphotransferase family protein [Candidatus Polarisedimenticolia bacterium]
MTHEEAQRFALTTLLPSMGLTGRPFTAAALPGGGGRTSLHLIRIDSMPPLLLKAHTQRRHASKNVEALRHMEALGLPAPRLVFHDLIRGGRFLPGPGPFVTVETWIEGTAHSSIEDPGAARDAALKVAALLARFHEVTRPEWGRPDSTRYRSFSSFTLQGIRRMSSELLSREWLDAEQGPRIMSCFDSWEKTIGELRPFQLVHNDANRHNFVLTPAGQVIAVDLHRLAYEPFVEEVVNALYHFCRKDEELSRLFLLTYLTRAGDAARETFMRTRGFFTPLSYLKKMYRRATAGAPAAGDEKMARWRDVVARIASPGRS